MLLHIKYITRGERAQHIETFHTGEKLNDLLDSHLTSLLYFNLRASQETLYLLLAGKLYLTNVINFPFNENKRMTFLLLNAIEHIYIKFIKREKFIQYMPDPFATLNYLSAQLYRLKCSKCLIGGKKKLVEMASIAFFSSQRGKSCNNGQLFLKNVNDELLSDDPIFHNGWGSLLKNFKTSHFQESVRARKIEGFWSGTREDIDESEDQCVIRDFLRLLRIFLF